MEEKESMVPREELIRRVRAAVEDRAAWFALLYEEFCTVLPEEKVIELCRKAIRKYGAEKAATDPRPFEPKNWVIRHRDKGSAEIFNSDIEYDEERAVQKMKYCPLVEAWKKMGYGPDKQDLFCDIAMDGDRARADGHPGIVMELHETIGKGCDFCRLVIRRD